MKKGPRTEEEVDDAIRVYFALSSEAKDVDVNLSYSVIRDMYKVMDLLRPDHGSYLRFDIVQALIRHLFRMRAQDQVKEAYAILRKYIGQTEAYMARTGQADRWF